MNRLLLILCAMPLLLFSPRVSAELPKDVAVHQDIAYGADPAQRIDVYLPPKPSHAPILFMVHGGGWRRGDKDNTGVVDNKVARWVPKGIIFVSVDYRMMPDAEPLTQAEDVARALAKVQELAPGWGGDPANIILMGHSAGAHLVALVTAAPEIAAGQGAKPWKGSVLLDSGAMDVPAIMNARHWPLYDKAFGSDPAKWEAASPFHRLAGPTLPMLAVCRERGNESCPANQAFALKAAKLGGNVDVLPMALSHGEINMQLGLPGAYTERVEEFMRGLGWKL
ncbi:MAG TPA: alpha/beta hydrolase [Candidatus Angelobacter sp.]|nr:alpha/beta hydrolase [Candidatus Angelobacter sp.]